MERIITVKSEPFILLGDNIDELKVEKPSENTSYPEIYILKIADKQGKLITEEGTTEYNEGDVIVQFTYWGHNRTIRKVAVIRSISEIIAITKEVVAKDIPDEEDVEKVKAN